ncbi:MAG: DUF4142 domain-containing protein [Verrucomicrobiota bacterium]
MKNKKIIGAIVAANLAVGMSAAFAIEPNDTTAPGTPRAQEQQDAANQPRIQGENSAAPATDTGVQVSGQNSKTGAEVSTQDQTSATTIKEAAGAHTKPFDKEHFIKDAAQGGVAEVNMGELGTQKGQDPAVKELAQRLVADHSKANAELKEIAQKCGIALSAEVDAKQQKMMDHLNSLSGAEFDKAFAMHMVKDHKKDIAKFEKAAASKDADVAAFAKATLPTLKEHLQMAEKISPEQSAGVTVDEPAGAQPSDQQKNYKSSSDANAPSTDAVQPSTDTPPTTPK